MNKNLLTNGYILVRITVLVMFLLLTVSGCKKPPSEKQHDPVIYAINKSARVPGLPPEVKNRANLAISKWENGTLDPKPILINAILVSPGAVNNIDLALTIFDEDKDVVGFGLREQHIMPNGEREIIEEIYPAFIHCPLYCVANVWLVTPLDIRMADERKDEQQWQKHVDNEQILQEYEHSREVLKRKIDSRTSSPISEALLWAAAAKFPAVWVSIPEPNKVDVSVWIYDKVGHKSKAVKLLNFLNYTEEYERKELNNRDSHLFFRP